ncbi:hypothetical protein [Pectobacterium fontis]|uniref:Uncharacterized protein n=1 Tax=Pectobacterium fontis TaxID=2558042 RepID=A0A7V8IFT6_9GAMM|nr:hypothetical protein [Pectobacterium fontis]KHN49221.1 hypothetical protein OI69_18580 [Pectobacterium fontis]
MNIYGYESDDGELLSLKEITLQLSVDELTDVIKFMENTLSLMKKHENFGHEHFKDYIRKPCLNMPDLIVSK